MLERKKITFIIFPVKTGEDWTQFRKWKLRNVNVSASTKVLLIILKINETVV